jgi:hypothetical protein
MKSKEWTVAAILAEIDEARDPVRGDPNYEDEMLLKLDKVVREPKKLIIFREHSLGGVIYNVNSNVKFDEVITVDMTTEATAGKDAADYDEVQELAVVDGDYGSAAWVTPVDALNRRMQHWRERMIELELEREEAE